MSKVRVAVIGCGGIATGKHLPALVKVKEVELAFCDIIVERAEQAKAKYGAVEA
jgi:predicted dehydrogenase